MYRRLSGQNRIFGLISGQPVIRPELWETKISRPATLDECICDFCVNRALPIPGPSGVRGAYGSPAIIIDHHFFKSGCFALLPERSSPGPSPTGTRWSRPLWDIPAGRSASVEPVQVLRAPDPLDRSDARRPGRAAVSVASLICHSDAMGRQRKTRLRGGWRRAVRDLPGAG